MSAANDERLAPPSGRQRDERAVVSRLFGYVGGPGRRGRFWTAVGLRALSVIALTAVPAITGGGRECDAMRATSTRCRPG